MTSPTPVNTPKCPTCGAEGEHLFGHYMVKVGRSIDGTGVGVDMDHSSAWESTTTEWTCEECGREWSSRLERPL